MGTNLNLLFDDSYREPKKSENQKKFEEKNEMEISVIVNIINDAHEEMRRLVNEMQSRFRNHLSKANRMNEQIKGKLIEHYGDKIKTLKYNRFGLLINGYVFLFKKFTGSGYPSNIRTGNSVMLSSQGKLNFPGEPEIVFIGFTVTPGYEFIQTIKAVKIVNEQIQWAVDLQRLAGDIGRAGTVVITPVDDTPDGPVITAKPGAAKRVIEPKKTG